MTLVVLLSMHEGGAMAIWGCQRRRSDGCDAGRRSGKGVDIEIDGRLTHNTDLSSRGRRTHHDDLIAASRPEPHAPSLKRPALMPVIHDAGDLAATPDVAFPGAAVETQGRHTHVDINRPQAPWLTLPGRREQCAEEG